MLVLLENSLRDRGYRTNAICLMIIKLFNNRTSCFVADMLSVHRYDIVKHVLLVSFQFQREGLFKNYKILY